MTVTLKQYADYFAIALEIGLPIKREVIIWADNLISNISNPSAWMIDLSTSKSKSMQNTITFLKEVEGNSDFNISLKLVIAQLSITYPFIKQEKYHILGGFGNWYCMNQELISFDLPFIEYFEVMGIEPRNMWSYFFDPLKIPEYYQALTFVGKDFKNYLPLKQNQQLSTNNYQLTTIN